MVMPLRSTARVLSALAASAVIACTPQPQRPSSLAHGPRRGQSAKHDNVVPIAVGTSWTHTCALLSNGTVACWGRNEHGQIGDGTTTDRHAPVPVPGLSGVKEIALGLDFTCALVSSGAVLCWGHDVAGQLGDGSSTDRHTPTLVRGLMTASHISAGYLHACAVLVNGHVACWGLNLNGVLGDGTSDNRLSPVPVQGISHATAVATGGYSTCALLNTGEVYCWGDLPWAPTTRPPAPVPGLRNVTAIAGKFDHTCALVGGKVACWGPVNIHGELGDGTTSNRTSPVMVTGVSGASSIDAGDHSCAVLRRGEVECWGPNAFGQLGDGTTETQRLPTPVRRLRDVVQVSTGSVGYTCALVRGGTVKCWGGNAYGELGDGTTVDRHLPTNVEWAPSRAR